MTGFEIHSIDQWDTAAYHITQNQHYPIIAFYGDMGSGKTTLIRALCKSFGSVDQVNSPTFFIINEYVGSRHKIYHFDFYRIKEEAEIYDLGYEDYLYSGDICLIEWPEKIGRLLPDPHHSVTIKRKNQEQRIITFN
ncbi:MAG: tRNA (adenosine(37)-N6)-threonylcarbamoyltransferase complex ATPase subunit type 1 TsaE [Flavobacteriales bacterium Tduv]